MDYLGGAFGAKAGDHRSTRASGEVDSAPSHGEGMPDPLLGTEYPWITPSVVPPTGASTSPPKPHSTTSTDPSGTLSSKAPSIHAFWDERSATLPPCLASAQSTSSSAQARMLKSPLCLPLRAYA